MSLIRNAWRFPGGEMFILHTSSPENSCNLMESALAPLSLDMALEYATFISSQLLRQLEEIISRYCGHDLDPNIILARIKRLLLLWNTPSSHIAQPRDNGNAFLLRASEYLQRFNNDASSPQIHHERRGIMDYLFRGHCFVPRCGPRNSISSHRGTATRGKAT